MCMTSRQFVCGSPLPSSEVCVWDCHSFMRWPAIWPFLAPKSQQQRAHQCSVLIVGSQKLSVLLSANDIPYFGDSDLGMTSTTWMALMPLGLTFIWWLVRDGLPCVSCSLQRFSMSWSSMLQIVTCLLLLHGHI